MLKFPCYKYGTREGFFHKHWVTYLSLIEQWLLKNLDLKIYTYAFNLRPKLYIALESCGFKLEQRLINHVDIDGVMTDVLIHSKLPIIILGMQRLTIRILLTNGQVMKPSAICFQ